MQTNSKSLAERRAARQAHAEEVALFARHLKSGARFGEDSAQQAFVRAIDNGKADPWTDAYRNGRGEASHAIRSAIRGTAALRRLANENPGRPNTDTGLMDELTDFRVKGRGAKGVSVDWDAAAAALGLDVAELRARAIGTLQASGLVGTRANGEPGGDEKQRARSAGCTKTELRAWAEQN